MVIDDSIWKLTRNDRLIGEISGFLLEEGSRVALLEGSRGRGKSFLGKTLGTLWSERGGVALLAEGDRVMAEREYFPFSQPHLRLDETWKYFSAATQIVDMILPLLAVYGLTSQGIVNLFRRMKVASLQASVTGLSSRELEILARMDAAARKKPILLIADNVHWWDQASLEFLYLLLRAFCDADVVSPLAFNVLLILTNEDEQPAVHGDLLRRTVLPFVGRSWRVGELERVDLAEALKALRLGKSISNERVLDSIWRRCGSHLPSLAMIAQMLDRHPDKVDEEAVKIVDGHLIDLQLKHPDVTREVLETIRCAAILGRNFVKGEIICLTRRDPEALDEELRLAEDINLVETFEGMYSFTHDDWKIKVFEDAERAKPELYRRLAQCLRNHRAGDYLLRHFAEFEAGRTRPAAELLAAALVQRLRQAVEASALQAGDADQPGDFGGILTGTRKDLLAQTELDSFVCGISEGYRLFLSGNIDRAMRVVEDLSPSADMILLKAEVDYLYALILLEYRAQTERNQVRHLLARWKSFWDNEPEAGLRLRLLYLYTLALDKGNENNQEVFDEIEEFCARNVENEYGEKNAAILSELHILYRMAPAHFDRPIAIRRIKDAVHFFGPERHDELPRRADEYFRALTNLGSNEVALGRYEEARETLETALDVSRNFPAIHCIDPGYAMNNRVIGAYRSGEVQVDVLVQTLRGPALQSPRFDMLLTLNFASAANISGDHRQTEAALRRVDEVVAGRRSNEPFDMYILEMTRAVWSFHDAGVRPTSEEWGRLRGLAERIPYPTGRYFLTRHDMLLALFDAVEPGAHADFEKGLEVYFPEQCAGLDAYYTRGNLLIVIEYWTHA